MHRLDPTGIYLTDYSTEELIPFEKIVSIRRINILWSIVLGFQIWKPVISERYLDANGDPFCLALLETRTERHLIRGGDIDQFIAEVRISLSASQGFRRVE